MAGKGKKEITGADEAGKRGGPGRPRLSEEEKIKKKDEKNKKSRESRATTKLEHEAHKAFCLMPGITVIFEAFRDKFMRKINEESIEAYIIEDL
ncbi:hypothetical protein SLEP1_g53072 [Rubroshorea leprosula]|uniref:Uncharacterized protein n=1 Tax=Rubroshorea leprosula TaxID=152421 RepID=A0AAV5MAL0_9ROSI|nr:hypothetical protein SLEP1_g53072 [Rubroshorea leprosula]